MSKNWPDHRFHNAIESMATGIEPIQKRAPQAYREFLSCLQHNDEVPESVLPLFKNISSLFKPDPHRPFSEQEAVKLAEDIITISNEIDRAILNDE